MWEIVERMIELNITPNAQTFTLIMDRFIRAENLEMVVQYMGEMVNLGLVPELQTAHNIVILAAKLGHPRLAIEMANHFEDSSIRRLDNEVWLNCLIGSAEDLYVSVSEPQFMTIIELNIHDRPRVCRILGVKSSMSLESHQTKACAYWYCNVLHAMAYRTSGTKY